MDLVVWQTGDLLGQIEVVVVDIEDKEVVLSDMGRGLRQTAPLVPNWDLTDRNEGTS